MKAIKTRLFEAKKTDGKGNVKQENIFPKQNTFQRKTTKIVLACIIILFPLWGLGGFTATAQTVIASGNCGAQGNNLTWVLTSDSTLTISGSGDMGYSIPWNYYRNAITTVLIGDSVTSIGQFAFNSCSSLISVIIPNSVITIEYSAFSYCNSLTSVIIGNSVITISDRTFLNCSSLASITSHAITPPMLGGNIFYGVPNSIPVYIPCLTYDNYSNDSGWSYFSNFVVNGSDTIFDSVVSCSIPYTDSIFTDSIYYSGTYYKTVLLDSNANCETVVCLTLTVNQHLYAANICQGVPYTDNNFTNLTQSGIYYTILQSANSCDSIVSLNLTVTPAPITNYSANICQGSTYIDGNFTNLTKTGIYYDTLQNSNGCDSIVCLSLFVINCNAQDTIRFTWQVSESEQKRVSLSAPFGTYFTVDWGNDSIEIRTGGSLLSPLYTAGTYTVTVVGSIAYNLSFNHSIISIKVCGNTTLRSLFCLNSVTSIDLIGCTALEIIDIASNNLTTLNVSGCTRLENLDVRRNNLTTLNASGCTELKILRCNDNQLSVLDVNGCTSLEELYATNNQLTALDVNGFTKLKKLGCNNNQISVLDVSTCTALYSLDCSSNQLTILDVSGSTALELYCNNNNLTVLDVSHCIGLSLSCRANNLTRLKVNSNTKIQYLSCYNNRLPLSDLYAAAACVNPHTYCFLGTQRLFPQVISIGDTVDFSLQSEFDGKNTVFVVEKDGMPAIENIDYSISSGIITFYTTGDYTITMTNAAVNSFSQMPGEAENHPAKVIAEITVVTSGSTTLSNISVSEGMLTPAFSSSILNYTVNVGYSVSSMMITATATDSNAVISGDIGLQQLEVGGNIFTITVRSADGKKYSNYIVTVNRADTIIVNITDIIQEISEIKVYPNPTSSQLIIDNGELIITKYEIYDILGRKQQTECRMQNAKIIVDVSALSSGIYFLHIQANKGIVVKKILKL